VKEELSSKAYNYAVNQLDFTAIKTTKDYEAERDKLRK
jgi:hypothetical protein